MGWFGMVWDGYGTVLGWFWDGWLKLNFILDGVGWFGTGLGRVWDGWDGT
jgi:hypothetical protein